MKNTNENENTNEIEATNDNIEIGKSENSEQEMNKNKENIQETKDNETNKVEKDVEETKDSEISNGKENEQSTKEKAPKGTKEKKKKSKVLGTIGLIFRTIILVIILISIFLGIRAAIFKKYDIFGYRFYIIMSGSMEPTIDPTDLVIIKEGKDGLQKGDVVAFHTGQTITVHRIHEVITQNNQTLYETKGDYNNAVDIEKLPSNRVVGKVVSKIPKVGSAILYVYNHMIYFIIGVAAIIIVLLIRRLF